MPKFILSALMVLSLASVAYCEKIDDIAYPTADNPDFVISVPSDWKMTQAENAGDFFHLDGPTGALFSFRTIEGSNDALNDAIKESLAAVHKDFTDVKIGDPEDWTPAGLKGFYATGEGKDKDGVAVRIGMGWCVLKDGKIVELWFVTDMTDTPGMEAAGKIANSLRSPE